MKVRITMTVNIDPEEWSLTYDVDEKDVREDVKRYVINAVQQSAGIQDCRIEG